MASGVTRRAILAGIAGAAARAAEPAPKTFPPERVGYADPSTEFWTLRLTSPEHASYLPRPPLRFTPRRRSYVIYANDRTGSQQLYMMQSTTGESRQLTSAADFDSTWFTLEPDDRGVLFFDGPSLQHLAISSMREHQVYRTPEGWRRAPGLGISRDGGWAFVPETNGESSRVQMVSLLAKPQPTVTAIASPGVIAAPCPRPQHGDVLFEGGPNSFWLAATGAGQRRQLSLAPGGTGQLFWSADGERITYLNRPDQPGRLNSLREYIVDTGTDQFVSATSQFASFSPNGNASVFVGASGSKASPHVLLLLRVTRRELTLCEHKASDPARVYPVFSPDSERIYFQSDRHGRPAIYTIGVERLVEKTG